MNINTISLVSVGVITSFVLCVKTHGSLVF